MMIITRVADYIKDRRLGSVYPCIDTKPDSKVIKTIRKIQCSVIANCVKMYNAFRTIRHKPIMGLELCGRFFCNPPQPA